MKTPGFSGAFSGSSRSPGTAMPKTALSRIIPLYPANSIQLVPLSFSLSNMGVLNENGGIAMGKGAPILRILSLMRISVQ